jgi:uncharacterized protein DUF1552
MILGKKLERRTFLRGMGTVVALPFLDAMVPALAAPGASKSPVRMAFSYVPNGIIMEDWLPKTEGDIAAIPTELPRISKNLLPFREDMMMFEGLTCNFGRSLGDGPGDHGRAGASYLTCSHVKKTFGKDIFVGTSMDQVAASHIGNQTRFASLELGCEEGLQGGNCDSGYSCVYSNNLSWRGPSSPLAPEVRPRAVFERLFGTGDFERDPVKRAQAQQARGSIMDVVLGSAQRLKNTLGATDQHKLDEYMFAVRDIEKRIEKAEQENASGTAVVPPIDAPASSVPVLFQEHARLMYDLMVVAFQTNATRIITLQIATEGSGRAYREVGISEGHHGLTHHMGDTEKIEKVTQINELHVKQFAYFLDKMKHTQDGDGTLLDHSMIIYGSGIADGNRHAHDNVPTILAGRGGGPLRPGRYIKYPKETPIANLWLSMLHRMGVAEEKIGDSTGEVAYLSEV